MKLFGLTIVSAEYIDSICAENKSLREGTDVLRAQRDDFKKKYDRLAIDSAEEQKLLQERIETQQKIVQLNKKSVFDQLARINNTNDRLRTFGKALTMLRAHITAKPEGKVSPKVRQEWNDKFTTLWVELVNLHVTRVTDYERLSQTEKADAEKASA